MYRESLALALHKHRPNFEVMLGPTASLDGQAKRFQPHLLIRNDTDGVDMDLMKGIRCWIEILYSDGMDATAAVIMIEPTRGSRNARRNPAHPPRRSLEEPPQARQ